MSGHVLMHYIWHMLEVNACCTVKIIQHIAQLCSLLLCTMKL